jgi:ferredoxin-NADP reductase
LSARILLVTEVDETHRQPLLESQGYQVSLAAPGDISNQLRANHFHLALIATDGGIGPTLAICEQMKNLRPNMQVAIIAQRAEYVPASASVNAVIRQQHSPGRFLCAVRTLIDVVSSEEGSASAAGDP